jgi:hypothetical protein
MEAERLTDSFLLVFLVQEPQCKGIREMVAADVPLACKLLNQYLDKFSLKGE